MPKQLKNNELISKIVLTIKELRKKNKITLESFYFDTGIHLARIEQGKQNITISTLNEICAYFNISLSEFFVIVEKKSNIHLIK